MPPAPLSFGKRESRAYRGRMDATSPADLDALPRGEYGFPGPLRDCLVGAVLAGRKTATACLLAEHERAGEPVPRVGDREAVLDSAGEPVAVTRVTAVDVVPFADVDDAHARAEGEDYDDAAGWRAAHRDFWSSPEFLARLGEPVPVVDDTAPVVLTRFALEWRRAPASSGSLQSQPSGPADPAG